MDNFKQNLQEASGFLRTAERNMFSGKNQEAVELLNKAEALYLELLKANSADLQVKSLFSKMEKLRKDLEKKGVKTFEGGKAELPFEVNAHLQRIKEGILSNNLDYAKREMDSFYSRFAGPYTDLPEVKEMKSLIESKEKAEQDKQWEKDMDKAANIEKVAEHEHQCEEWRLKFQDVGYFDGKAHNTFELSAHFAACRKAIAIVNEYMTVEFSMESDITLLDMVADTKRRVEAFIPNYMQTTNEMSSDIKERINQHIIQLQNDTAWTNDDSKMPLFTGQADMTALLNSIEEMREVCAENKDAFKDMMMIYSTLQELNVERKEIRSTRIRMKPEVMSLEEGKPLQDCAIEALKKNNPGIVVLKSAVVKNWDPKFEEGWEDNTQSKWVKRNFRQSTVQIAAEVTKGDLRLFNMYIEETLNPENKYVNTRSHIVFDEPMKVENL